MRRSPSSRTPAISMPISPRSARRVRRGAESRPAQITTMPVGNLEELVEVLAHHQHGRAARRQDR